MYSRRVPDYMFSFALRVQTSLNLQARAAAKVGNSKSSWSFLKANTSTRINSMFESEKASYVAHINIYLRDDPYLKKFLPIDPSTNGLFELAKDGVLLWYLTRVCFIILFFIFFDLINSYFLMQ